MSQANGVAVDSAHVYWARIDGCFFGECHHSIGRANLDGSGVGAFFIDFGEQVFPVAVAVDAAHIYWGDSANNTIGRANLDGTGVDQSFITTAGTPWGVAVDGSHVYWVSYGVGTIGRANLDGTGVDQSFVTGANGPQGVAVDGSHVYWANNNAGTIGRANLDGTGIDQSFITGASLPVGVVVDALPGGVPTASAGPDQKVDEGTSVGLDGSGSSDPEGQALTYSWSQLSGPAVALSDPSAVMPTFTAPDVVLSTPLTFQLEVCDPTPLCDTDSVMVTVNPVFQALIDAAGEVLVMGGVKAGDTRKAYVFRVSNLGVSSIAVNSSTDIDAAVLVDGTENGTVTVPSGTKTISPGSRTRFRLSWTGGPLVAGDTVEFTACVAAAGDIVPTNNCDSATRTAG